MFDFDFMQVLELVNQGEPSVGVMEVWTRPHRSSASSASKATSPAMSLLFSLAAAIEENSSSSSSSAAGQGGAGGAPLGVDGGSGSGSAVSGVDLDVALAAPVGVSNVTMEGVVAGDAVKLPLRLSAGQAGDRDVVTEVGGLVVRRYVCM